MTYDDEHIEYFLVVMGFTNVDERLIWYGFDSRVEVDAMHILISLAEFLRYKHT